MTPYVWECAVCATRLPSMANPAVSDGAPRKRSIIHDNFNLSTWPYWGVHIMAVVGPIWLVGFSWSGVGLALATYAAGIFLVTAGYHRYFSHRTYKTCLLYTSPSPRDGLLSRMPSSA